MISFLANAESNVTVTFHFPLPLQVTRAESLLRRTSSDLDEDELYLRRLDMGLFTLQLVDFIVAEACASAAGTVKQRVLKILGQRGANVPPLWLTMMITVSRKSCVSGAKGNPREGTGTSCP